MIKLIKADIIRYKCIEKEQSFDIEDDVTVLVGMNESGKTSILEALAKTNYFEEDDNFSFNMTHDFPRKQKKAADKSGKVQTAVVLDYKIGTELIEEITKDFRVKPSKDIFSVKYKYDNKRTWSVDFIKTAEFMKVKILSLEFEDKCLSDNLQKISTKSDFIEILESVRENVSEKSYSEDDMAKLDSLKIYFDDSKSWENSPIDEYIVQKYIIPNLPKFMYYDDYYSLPSRVSLTKLEANPKESSKKTAKALLELADIDIDTLTKSDDFEEFIAELEATEAIISEELFKYWTTNNNLKIKFRINKKEETDSYNNNRIVERILDIRVENQRTGVSLPLENRSKGFNWFFSFLVWFMKIQEDRNATYILLLDEPGLNLHAKAQNDLLKFLADLSNNYQIIYTTHSPFMIETDKLNKVRTVFEKKDGTLISDSVQEKDPNTLFPLQAALGYDLAQNLFVSNKNLLVEGIADLTYISIISAVLEAKGKEGLSQDITIVPVGGADKVATFISLMRGNKLKMVCLLDTFTEQSAKKRLENMIVKNIIKENKILFYHDILKRDFADVEDLFNISDYIYLYNHEFNTNYEKNDFNPDNSILSQLKDKNGGKDFNHYRPANFLAKNISDISLSEKTLENFEKLFKVINSKFV
ncbi:AAA family ATPase [Parvimonas sp. D2]|uniref:AAA family ATPase n=1 Tax=unclassified Parvimonas TaxID=1151464 RepID=UPI002B477003|nr:MULTISPECIES: AAA family ATPase [unclassified Parvimonas]MEB3011436.1 AAA family ATPase [Parvimonas sp. D2]MEB3086928.1 AAA family ATPase [Parvimonas sp. D4]